MIINDSRDNHNDTRSLYYNVIEEFNKIPMERYSVIYNIIASYYARKYLNRYPGMYSKVPDIKVISEMFGGVINKINSDFIIDVNKVIVRIVDHINYYRTITFHEWVSDGVTYPKCDSLGLSQDAMNAYYSFGYSTIYSVSEYKDILDLGERYTDLVLSFGLGAKHIKNLVKDLPEDVMASQEQ